MGKLTHPILDPLAVTPKALGRILHRPRHDGPDQQEDRRQRCIDVQHIGDQADDGEAVTHDGGQDHGRGGGDVLHIVSELGQDLTGAVAIVIAGGGTHQVLEHLPAQIRHHPPPHPLEEIVIHEPGAAPEDEHGHQQHRHDTHHIRITVDKAAVQQGLHHGGEERLRRRVGEHPQDREGKGPPVGFRVTE